MPLNKETKPDIQKANEKNAFFPKMRHFCIAKMVAIQEKMR